MRGPHANSTVTTNSNISKFLRTALAQVPNAKILHACGSQPSVSSNGTATKALFYTHMNSHSMRARENCSQKLGGSGSCGSDVCVQPRRNTFSHQPTPSRAKLPSCTNLAAALLACHGREHLRHASLTPHQTAPKKEQLRAHTTLAAAAGETTALPLEGTPLSALGATDRGSTCIRSPSDVWIVAPCHNSGCTSSRCFGCQNTQHRHSCELIRHSRCAPVQGCIEQQ